MDINSKNRWRKEAKGYGEKLEEHTYNRFCQQTHEQLYQQPEWKDAETIAVTVSMGREINTTPIIHQMWEAGKQPVVPKCYPKAKQLVFHNLNTFEDLETVYFGLKEPIESKTKAVNKDDIDLVIVPGLVFDGRGYRIGFGGGYYDRFLEDYKGSKLSLAYDALVTEELTKEAHDISVDKIITPARVIKTKNDQV